MATSTSDLLRDYSAGAFVALLLTLGERTGLVATLAAAPATPTELAVGAGVDERNVREWLRGMRAAGLAAPDGDRWTLAPEVVAGPWSRWLGSVSAMIGEVDVAAEAMRTGRGITGDRLTAAYAPASWHFNDDRYDAALVGWLERHDGLVSTLEAGGRVDELGSGAGHALGLVAARFPAARVVGHDTDPAARAASRADHPSVEVTDALVGRGLDSDLVLVLDVLHHLGEPARALAECAAALRPGGLLVVAEPTRHDVPAPDPDGLGGAVSALFFCMQEALAAGGEGFGDSVPPALVAGFATGAGLEVVEQIEDAATGFTVTVARRRPPR